MNKAVRTVVYDAQLGIEAYRLEGIVQPFPNHFHEHYVIGLVECGERRLSCKNRVYTVGKGGLVLFHPGDNHACTQRGSGALDYRGLNIPEELMLDLTEEITGKREPPGFSQTVVYDTEAACYLWTLHKRVMSGVHDLGTEEALLCLMTTLLQAYGQPFARGVPECRREVERACDFMERHFAERVSLEQICRRAGLSKSTLLRAFAKARGITPYRYLETVRINEAKKLLGEGVPPAEAAVRTGFSDQSHFTNYFTSVIGLAPGAYREIFLDRDQNGEKKHET